MPQASAQQHALDCLRQLIVGRELSRGDRVHEEDLAERLGVSVALMREALRTLEQEGQVTYFPRRGYVLAELELDELREIYGLRRLLEERALRAALPGLDEEAIARVRQAAADCASAVSDRDVASQIAANRRFHFAMLETPSQPHTFNLIRLLWDLTETYRALYYNSSDERVAAVDAHDRILDAILDGDADRAIAELDSHRQRALEVLNSMVP